MEESNDSTTLCPRIILCVCSSILCVCSFILRVCSSIVCVCSFMLCVCSVHLYSAYVHLYSVYVYLYSLYVHLYSAYVHLCSAYVHLYVKFHLFLLSKYVSVFIWKKTECSQNIKNFYLTRAGNSCILDIQINA